MSKVYFATSRSKKWIYSDSMPGKLEELLKKIDLPLFFEKNEWVAVKTHFGSEGAHRIIRPIFLRKVVESVKASGAKPFVTDTVRIKGLDYLEVANQNGINHLSVGAPVVLADGLYGNDSIIVKAGKILGEIAVASVIHDVSAMVVCSHIKGHIQAGYGGSIKNIAMGGVSSQHRHKGWKCGRGAMHTIGEGDLIWDEQKCTMCFQCMEICPLEAINFRDNVFSYNNDLCWRCGRCSRVCPTDALTMPSDDKRFMQGLAEAAQAVLSTFKPKKVLYINFLTEIQPECDCMPSADVPVIQDQGIMISDDIVAIEQATIDMILKSKPLPQSAAQESEIHDVLFSLWHRPYKMQVEAAEKLGLGNRKYNLITL